VHADREDYLLSNNKNNKKGTVGFAKPRTKLIKSMIREKINQKI